MKFATLLFFCAMTTVVIESRRQYLDLDENSLKEILNSDRKLSELLEDPELLDVLRRTLKTDKKCNVATDRSETIIKTKESQLAGAVFLSAPAANSRKECINACCANTSCNTAIIKHSLHEDDAGCYLFDCGDPSVCVFSTHVGFSAVQLYSRRHTEDKPSGPVDGGLHPVKTTTKSTASTTVSSSTTSTQPSSISGHLHSSCRERQDCVGHHVDCVKGLCTCKEGYHAVGSVCRQDCGRYQFECTNADHPERADCIPIYGRCDGTAKCPDGSDEVGCSTVPPTKPHGGPVASTSPQIDRKTGGGSTTVLSSTARSASGTSDNTPGGDGERRDSVVKIESRVATASVSKGAAIALALGLAVVVLLAIFGACQLRRSRSRSLKGRLRNPKEADYLINGMYL